MDRQEGGFCFGFDCVYASLLIGTQNSFKGSIQSPLHLAYHFCEGNSAWVAGTARVGKLAASNRNKKRLVFVGKNFFKRY